VSRSLPCHPRWLIVVISMDVSSPHGLAGHAETLADYLYEYGSNPDGRSEISMIFSEYLLSVCWDKLYGRFCSWERLGLIRIFEEDVGMLVEHLKVELNDSLSEPGIGDQTLVNFLFTYKDTIFGNMLPSVVPKDHLPVSVFDKFREAVVYAYDNQDLKSIYTKETALGFHYLVYCVFLLAGQALKKIKDHSQPVRHIVAENRSSHAAKEKNKEYRSQIEAFKNHIKAAIIPMKFLQFVLTSSVFKAHIRIWTNDGESLHCLLPKWTEKKDNLFFGIKRQIIAESRLGPQEESPIEGGNGDGDTPNESPTGGGENSDASKESPSEGDEDHYDDDDDDDAPEVCNFIW
jgi:hypothetical protein